MIAPVIRALLEAARRRLRKRRADAPDDVPSGPYAGLGDAGELYAGAVMVAILLMGTFISIAIFG